MAKTMKAAVVREFGKPLTIDEVPVPEPGPGEIQVEIQASGVCHTDLHAAEGDWPVKPNPPFIPGHEGVGFVSAVGQGVRHVKEGDRVGVPWLYTACGHCRHCLGGWETLCAEQKNTGYSVNGGFAEYVVADPNYVGHLPANIDFVEIAPVLCAGVTVYKGLKVTDTKPGDWVVISGIGGLGHMAVQYAKAMGMNVAAVDIADDKLELARKLGATLTVNALKEDPAAVIKRETGGGAQGVLVTAVSRKAFEQAIGMVGRGGTVALNGLPPGDFPLDIFGMVLNGITVRGSIVGTRLDLQESLDFAAQGKVKATISTREARGRSTTSSTRMHKGQIEGRIVLDIAGLRHGRRGRRQGERHPGGARAARRDRRRPRAGAVPPVRRLLRRLLADVLSRGRVPDRRQRRPARHGRRARPSTSAAAQYQAWKHTDLVIDVVPGRGGMFSLDNGRERRFLTRSTALRVPPA